ncbi:M14 family metallopeptidase [Peribacillus kribbensis]|uniref:M14 family metallopeptidase n=1 Tax=Peribacillus kribbensis TaxID=356658 RepID=UPI0003F706A0|nr:M14 family metallopeptidase [Peribacillus kribbensis]
MKKVFQVTSIAMVLSISAGLAQPSSGIIGTSSAAEFVPYYGTGPSYVQPENIGYLFPKPNVMFNTPAFQEGRLPFTSQEEMMNFLKSLTKRTKTAKLTVLGKSIQGRDIPLLLFSENHDKLGKKNRKKPLVWVQAQIHGNEPAAGESALVLAQRIAEGKLGNVLDKVDIAIVPRINPDGSYDFKRTAANNDDANRDYMKVELPEVQTILRAVNEYKPDVVLDAHEYTVNSSPLKNFGEKGSLPSYDLLISSAKNLNIPERIRETSDNLLLSKVHKSLDKENLSYHDYYTLAMQGSDLVATEGSTETRIGRNALGMKNTLTYLIETRGINIGRADFERRVYAQVAAQSSFILHTAQNAGKVLDAVSKARSEVVKKGINVNDDDKVVVTSENKRMAGQKLKVVDLAKAVKTDIPIVWEDSTEAYATLERERPAAYILPPGPQSDVTASKLKLLGVQTEKLNKPAAIKVESYKVNSSTTQDELNTVTTSVTEKTQTFPSGSYMISMAQPNANFAVLALEPESVDSYVSYNFISAKTGEELPIYRYMGNKHHTHDRNQH